MITELPKGFMRILLLVIVITSFILYSPALAEEVLKIGGAGSALGSMKLLVAAFEKSHPGVKVVVLSSIGSIGGIKAVSKGGIGIGLTGRPLNKEELKLGLSVIEYARTPIIFVTRNNINVSNLSTGEIIKIFRGEIQTWPNGERIRLILRQAAESNAIAVNQISPEMRKAMEIAMSRPWRLVALTDQESTDLVEKTPGAFGFCTLTQAISEKRNMKILFYNGISPITKNLVNDSYPLSKSHFMLTKAKPSAMVKEFIRFVRSSEGKRILEESGNSVIKGNPGQ